MSEVVSFASQDSSLLQIQDFRSEYSQRQSATNYRYRSLPSLEQQAPHRQHDYNYVDEVDRLDQLHPRN